VKVTSTALPEVKLIEPRIFSDDRGLFYESWNARAFADADLGVSFVQDNHSLSGRGVLRGLHYQLNQPQGKLVRVVRGAVYDVAVDMRYSSPRFGHWAGAELNAENKHMLWIPPGFAHGFLSLRDGTEFLYKCTEFYLPEDERSLLWSDPTIGIEWPLNGLEPIMSWKDRAGTPLAQADCYG
jgi:dTDP-4-dehydrorhamnose 3,5-epimerase